MGIDTAPTRAASGLHISENFANVQLEDLIICGFIGGITGLAMYIYFKKHPLKRPPEPYTEEDREANRLSWEAWEKRQQLYRTEEEQKAWEGRQREGRVDSSEAEHRDES